MKKFHAPKIIFSQHNKKQNGAFLFYKNRFFNQFNFSNRDEQKSSRSA